MAWHKKAGAGSTPHVSTPHVSVPKPSAKGAKPAKAHKAPAQHQAKAAKTSNQKTASYTAKPIPKK